MTEFAAKLTPTSKETIKISIQKKLDPNLESTKKKKTLKINYYKQLGLLRMDRWGRTPIHSEIPFTLKIYTSMFIFIKKK